MMVFIVLIAAHLLVVGAALPAVLSRQPDWAVRCSAVALVALAIAPLFLGMFLLSSFPYFNEHRGYALAAAFIYCTSIAASVASLLRHVAWRKGLRK